MLLGVSYEAALMAISAVDQKLATNGIYFTQLRKAAKQLGMTLLSQRKGRYDLQNSVGILSVQFKETGTDHAVVLFRGTVIDPDGGVVWDDVETFVEAQDVKLGSLLVLA
jgi:hypothetical protein